MCAGEMDFSWASREARQSLRGPRGTHDRRKLKVKRNNIKNMLAAVNIW